MRGGYACLFWALLAAVWADQYVPPPEQTELRVKGFCQYTKKYNHRDVTPKAPVPWDPQVPGHTGYFYRYPGQSEWSANRAEPWKDPNTVGRDDRYEHQWEQDTDVLSFKVSTGTPSRCRRAHRRHRGEE